MDATVYSEFLGVVDDAIRLADDAVKSAEEARRVPRQTEEVTLVKVAKVRCQAVAEALVKSGAFPGKTVADLAKTLELSGPAGHLDIMEKLASRAVFPLDLEGDLGGDLVEKSAASRTDGLEPGSPTAIWRKALDEAELECAG